MRIYHTGTNGLWVVILMVGFLLLSFLAVGGFLLGTPLGLAILTLLVVRHFYKRYQRKKYQEQFEGAYGSQSFGGFGDFGGFSQQSQQTSWQQEPEEPASKTFTEDFASKYKQAEQDIKVFSSEDRQNAVDVEYKEL